MLPNAITPCYTFDKNMNQYGWAIQHMDAFISLNPRSLSISEKAVLQVIPL